MKKILLLITFISGFFVQSIFASHIMGGEIGWVCDGNGKYVFTLVIYRDCTGTSYTNTSVDLNVPSAWGLSGNKISLALFKASDISPDCSGASLNCGTAPSSGAGSGKGAVARFIFKSTPIDLSAVDAPPPSGYIMTHTAICCRNTNTNTNCNSNMVLRAVMYPYEPPGSIFPLPLSECYDNSPTFSEDPSAVIYKLPNTTDSFTFNNNAYDLDLDSLSYEFDYPWKSDLANAEANNCGFSGAFTVDNPLPNLAPNQPNPETGEVTFSRYSTTTTNDAYITCFRVTAWRCGQKIAQVYRDFQTQLIATPAGYTNLPTEIDKPFNNNTQFDTAVFAGDTILFQLCADDYSNLGQPSGQTIKILFNGVQFGEDYTSTTTGCPRPPCAILNSSKELNGTAPQAVTNKQDTIGYGYTGVNSACSWFYWPTSCANLVSQGCGLQPAIFNFVVTAIDDQCDIPEKIIKSVSIKILPPNNVPDPLIRCITAEDNGDVTLNWETPTEGNFGNLTEYRVLKAKNRLGPYTQLGVIANLFVETYTIASADLEADDSYFYVTAENLCLDDGNIISPAQLIRTTALPRNQDEEVDITWNPLRGDLLSSSDSTYHVFREYPEGVIIELGTTMTTSFIDPINACGKKLTYWVEIGNDLPCNSVSTKFIIDIEETMTGFVTTTFVCSGKETEFTANMSNGYPPYRTFLWSGELGFSGSGPSTKHTYTQGGKHEFTVVVTDNAGCKFTITDSVLVGRDPHVTLGFDKICPTFETPMHVTVTGTNPPWDYKWFGQPGLGAVDSTANYIFSGEGKHAVSIKVTDNIGCFTIVTDSVEVHQPPFVFASPDTAICFGESVKIGFNGVPGDSYSWSSSSTLSNGTLASPTATPDSLFTQYEITATDGVTGCENKDKVNVSAFPKPVAFFTFNYDGTSVNFIGTAAFGVDKWTWDYGDRSNTDSIQTTNHIFAQAGLFTITLIVESKCGLDTIYHQIEVFESGTGNGSSTKTTSVNNTEVISGISIYPNPFSEVINITLKSDEIVADEMRLLNGLGQVVYSIPINSLTKEYTLPIQPSITEGVYLLEILNKKQLISSQTLIKSN
ncbi:MAG: hypothetical protein ACJAZ3_000513 [Sphingobacteriales bacterium]|jgi:hypothetical protein